ncbi:N-acetyltransferase, partial [Micrococcus endophyticus]
LAGAGRDRGVGTRALTLVLEHAFTTVGLHRVGLEVYDHNPRARHVYARLGFVHEGTLRQALLLDGEWIDCHVMGLLAHECTPAGRRRRELRRRRQTERS